MKKAAVVLCSLLAACGMRNHSSEIHLAAAQGSLGHMPVALADALGFYQAEGLAVTVELLPGTKTVEALLAGSADAASGVYEQTIQLAAEGQALRCFALLTHRDSRGLVVAPTRTGIRTIADLKGRNIGVSGLGSATQMFASHLLLRHGVKPEEVSFVGIGMGSAGLSAIERGVIDAAAVASGDFIRIRAKYPGAVVLADAITPEGSRAIFDSEVYPAMALLAKAEWLATHPEQARKLARAMRRTLAWLAGNSPAAIRDKLPPEYRTGDEALDLEALRVMKTIYSRDGVMPAGGPEVVVKALAATQEKVRVAGIDLTKTYTDAFVREEKK